ncbi:hypothetical protein KXD93_15905 [Mucilaginibacter sp. BJC16-A38]|uniref:hypothetical protein n=1 Tax=Mucilaginibacter phenanthrenivorans TaxID=1234842 RepID=UPI002157B4A6|nr:hypothetical protein [Mucilaginibacter phenanthrenivorans]MCR8559142.1 hypothetical protein [Mucilaginibacter phenanthrenivorans]
MRCFYLDILADPEVSKRWASSTLVGGYKSWAFWNGHENPASKGRLGIFAQSGGIEGALTTGNEDLVIKI